MNFFDYDFIISKIELVCRVKAGTGNRIHRDRPSHGLAFNLWGEKLYTFENGLKLRVRENDVIFLPQYSSYAVDDIAPGDCYAINFNINEKIDFRPFIMHAKNSESFLNAFASTEKAFLFKRPGYNAKCMSECYSIIYSLISEKNTAYISDTKKSLLTPALDYIHSQYTREIIDIDYLAQLCDMSPSYFRRLFHITLAQSPIKYINGLKLARAKELLVQDEFSLEVICELSGFNNVYYFCRLFKKTVGITPTEYKKSSTAMALL